MILKALLVTGLFLAPAYDSLFYLARMGDLKSLQTLVKQEQNLDLNHLSSQDYSALMYGVLREQEDVVQFLLQQGASPDFKNKRLQSALSLAAKGGQLSLVKLLHSSGSQVNQQDSQGNSPLMWASYWAHKDVVQYLLKAGANPNITNQEGDSALGLVIQGGQAAQINLSHQPLLLKDAHGRVFRLPSSPVDLLIIDTLLQYKAQINHANQAGQTPLMLAAEKQALDMVRLLLKRGADPGLTDKNGKNALDYTKDPGIRYLLSHS